MGYSFFDLKSKSFVVTQALIFWIDSGKPHAGLVKIIFACLPGALVHAERGKHQIYPARRDRHHAMCVKSNKKFCNNIYGFVKTMKKKYFVRVHAQLELRAPKGDKKYEELCQNNEKEIFCPCPCAAGATRSQGG
jgi:hypothetical protein